MTDTPPEEAAPAETEASTAVATRDPDPLRDPVLEALSKKLGDKIVGHEIAGGDMWVRVANDAWLAAVTACKDLGFTYFNFLSGLDWLPNPDLSGEKVYDPDLEPVPAGGPIVTGVAGGDTRFQVFARLDNLTTHVGITLKTDLDEEHPTVASVVSVFRGADWHERETWEMYGFEFLDHPGLRHLYLPNGFEGFPLRKDFPLLAREVKPWPGLVDVEPMPGEPEGEGEEASEGADA